MRTLWAEAPGPTSLRLEPQTAAHALQMFPVLSDPAIYRFENQPPASVAWLLQRFTQLESRGPADGAAQWLNWVVRIEDTEAAAGKLAGYVQATVFVGGDALVAYEFNSAWWGRGIAFAAVSAMLSELGAAYGVLQAFAVLKSANVRSAQLLQRLGFGPADPQHPISAGIDTDEVCRSRLLR
ncbi:MAG: GNAT family N-acetyltransferase [Pseudomonadota bacterium]|nr:GNAT family N-acetyltransferase [Pseudomonadota bacterium]